MKNHKGYYLEILMHELMKLLGSTEKKVNKDTNVENMPHLEITEVLSIMIINRIFKNL